MISLGRHLGSLLLGLATTALLLSGLAVALPVAGLPADVARVLSAAVRSAAIVDAGPDGINRDTVAAPVSRLRTVPRAVVAAAPAHAAPRAVPTTPAAAPDSTATTSRSTAKPATGEAASTKPAGKSAAGKPAATGRAAAVIAATNAERAEAGCDPLRVDSRLTAAAQAHAADMAANDYFSHTDQDGGRSADRIQDAGFDGSRTAENIAAGQETPAEVVADWMDSDGHRHNILNCAYDRIGVGYDSRGDHWVQNFGG